ncbi:hypothetical protein WJX72_003524 [[Myrmecia] bisecta]|uniref:Uncharacterized protein n=1 Tax=[Myrmecia] bisecta TaxID=41462 RepID=A0AAW1P6C6_9CHLO
MAKDQKIVKLLRGSADSNEAALEQLQALQESAQGQGARSRAATITSMEGLRAVTDRLKKILGQEKLGSGELELMRELLRLVPGDIPDHLVRGVLGPDYLEVLATALDHLAEPFIKAPADEAAVPAAFTVVLQALDDLCELPYQGTDKKQVKGKGMLGTLFIPLLAGCIAASRDQEGLPAVRMRLPVATLLSLVTQHRANNKILAGLEEQCEALFGGVLQKCSDFSTQADILEIMYRSARHDCLPAARLEHFSSEFQDAFAALVAKLPQELDLAEELRALAVTNNAALGEAASLHCVQASKITIAPRTELDVPGCWLDFGRQHCSLTYYPPEDEQDEDSEAPPDVLDIPYDVVKAVKLIEKPPREASAEARLLVKLELSSVPVTLPMAVLEATSRPFTLCFVLPKSTFDGLCRALPKVAELRSLSLKGPSQDSFPELTQRKPRVKMSTGVHIYPQLQLTRPNHEETASRGARPLPLVSTLSKAAPGPAAEAPTVGGNQRQPAGSHQVTGQTFQPVSAAGQVAQTNNPADDKDEDGESPICAQALPTTEDQDQLQAGGGNGGQLPDAPPPTPEAPAAVAKEGAEAATAGAAQHGLRPGDLFRAGSAAMAARAARSARSETSDDSKEGPEGDAQDRNNAQAQLTAEKGASSAQHDVAPSAARTAAAAPQRGHEAEEQGQAQKGKAQKPPKAADSKAAVKPAAETQSASEGESDGEGSDPEWMQSAKGAAGKKAQAPAARKAKPGAAPNAAAAKKRGPQVTTTYRSPRCAHKPKEGPFEWDADTDVPEASKTAAARAAHPPNTGKLTPTGSTITYTRKPRPTPADPAALAAQALDPPSTNKPGAAQRGAAGKAAGKAAAAKAAGRTLTQKQAAQQRRDRDGDEDEEQPEEAPQRAKQAQRANPAQQQPKERKRAGQAAAPAAAAQQAGEGVGARMRAHFAQLEQEELQEDMGGSPLDAGMDGGDLRGYESEDEDPMDPNSPADPNAAPDEDELADDMDFEIPIPAAKPSSRKPPRGLSFDPVPKQAKGGLGALELPFTAEKPAARGGAALRDLDTAMKPGGRGASRKGRGGGGKATPATEAKTGTKARRAGRAAAGEESEEEADLGGVVRTMLAGISQDGDSDDDGGGLEDLQRVLARVVQSKREAARQKQLAILQGVNQTISAQLTEFQAGGVNQTISAQLTEFQAGVKRELRDLQAAGEQRFAELEGHMEEKMAQMSAEAQQHQQRMHTHWQEYKALYTQQAEVKKELQKALDKKQAGQKRKLAALQQSASGLVADAEARISKTRKTAAKFPAIAKLLKEFV